MNEPSYKELKKLYLEALELIDDLSETLDKREWDEIFDIEYPFRLRSLISLIWDIFSIFLSSFVFGGA